MRVRRIDRECSAVPNLGNFAAARPKPKIDLTTANFGRRLFCPRKHGQEPLGMFRHFKINSS